MTKLKFFLLLAALAVNSFAANVRAAAAREIESFDKNWRFLLGDAAGAQEFEFNDANWRALDVPHDWSIAGAIDERNPTGKGGGFFPAGIGWYRKHFTVSEKDKNRRVFVEFDGVMANSDVWINGKHLGKRPYGYASFGYELTDYLNFGTENVVAVRADNRNQPASRWYTGAGIYRRVRLIATDAVHLERHATFVTTAQVAANQATVNVKSAIVNQSNDAQTVSLQIALFDAAGKTVGTSETAAQKVEPGKSLDFEKQIAVKNPQLWDVAKDVLYKAAARVRRDGKILDDEIVVFGIRDFRFEAATGFWLNNRNFKIKGVCLHHDGSAFGAAVPLAVWERRLNELRKLGVNAIRTAHNPPAPEFLDLTDRMGFLVMDELFDVWTAAKNPFDYHLDFNEWSKIDARDTVKRDRNHPSVIIYSAGNEIHDTPKPEIAIPILRGLVTTFHENDDTRPVTQGLFRPNVSKDYDNGLADILDVVGQNYREKEILAAHKQKPTRKILGTENTHDLNQWLAMRDNAPYAGQFIWAGVDYLGESGGFPAIADNFGLLDRTAAPRPVAFQRQSWWSDAPMVSINRRVAPSVLAAVDPGYDANERRPQVLFGNWTPRDLSKHQENVEIYSNCQEVELFLNDKSLGKKSRPDDDTPRNWTVDFEPGTIRAACFNNSKIAATDELKTAGKSAKIVLTADKTRLANDWNDVVFVTATVTDANGVIVPTANNLISFAISGAGTIAAVDSADNRSHEPFQADKRKAFQGKCLALIKANKNAGKITFTATAPNLQTGTVSLFVTKQNNEFKQTSSRNEHSQRKLF